MLDIPDPSHSPSPTEQLKKLDSVRRRDFLSAVEPVELILRDQAARIRRAKLAPTVRQTRG